MGFRGSFPSGSLYLFGEKETALVIHGSTILILAFAIIPRNQWLGKLNVKISISLLHKTTLLGTARILRRVLEL